MASPLVRSVKPPSLSALTGVCLLALSLFLPGSAQASGNIHIAKAAWSAAHGLLTVKGRCPSCAEGDAVSVYDSSARLLASGTADASRKFVFAVQDDRPELLCSVRVEAGGGSETKAVNGAPNKSCAKAPRCAIVTPSRGAAFNARQDVQFEATAKLKDENAGPLKLEWDFAGGSMGEIVPGSNPAIYKRPDTEKTAVQFVRDNSRYRVRFSATDAQNRRCEDAVEIVIGSPPSGLPAKVSEQTAPKLGGELDGAANDLVVLPYEQWTMQSDSDNRLLPNAYNSMSPTIHNVNAVVYKKGLKPALVGSDQIQLRYSAASNPADPAGTESINSTSQNWPLNANIREASPLMSATVQKTDMWEKWQGRPDAEKSPDYYISSYWAAFGSTYPFSGLPEPANPYPDEGNIIGRGKANKLTGSFMPGKDNPYTENQPQPFSNFDATEKSFMAKLLPYTDVDDSGRVNPYPLLRVQATQGNQVATATDGVVTASHDFKCASCHLKGKIGANPNAPFTPAAYGSSASGQIRVRTHSPENKTPSDKPLFFEATSDSLWDQEYAAMQNYSSLHTYYNATGHLSFILHGDMDDNGKTRVDAPLRCIGCHNSAMGADSSSFDEGWWIMDDFNTASQGYNPNYSVAMHRMHGELQWNENKSDIVRDSNGRFVRWDWKAKGRNAKSLFPVLDENGNALPMEANCLQCHAGHREQQYRDRMYTAGRTCYDCHGDMLAVGEAFPKDYLNHKDKLGSTELTDYRVIWFDEPDCGSCHIGDGNAGKDGANGFYSAGVMKRAFEDDDLSATTRPIDRNQPNSARFSAAPVQNFKLAMPTYYMPYDPVTDSMLDLTIQTQVDAPLFRYGKDSHGNVPCAACHGAAHSVWPNRDPNANDNVTALQLQGHTGAVLECNVCHSKDAFAQFANLDGGTYSGLPADSGVLGGPHNMHPVNDPNWWSKADADTAPISDGSTWGGWHDNVAQSPGRFGEDQCAACHGADHNGTRLSKTPVDREFVVKNGKKAKWKAGEAIGCDRCHSLERSFVKVPTSAGTPLTNHDPAITSAPVMTAILGQPYTYTTTASDPDGDVLAYSLDTDSGLIGIDPITGTVTGNFAMTMFSAVQNPPLQFPYTVKVDDGRGGKATQAVIVTLECPSGQFWYWDAVKKSGACKTSSEGVAITSTPSVEGINSGQVYTYQVTATDAAKLPLTFSLSGQPAGMTIDPASGLISWMTSNAANVPVFTFLVIAQDAQGGHASQMVALTVCVPPMSWHSNMKMCG
ncbi:MAG: putative Ig domain-containing protein [Methylococcus sp.]|nr:putative Ig domain-containing protein [Methylococcus sp.]